LTEVATFQSSLITETITTVATHIDTSIRETNKCLKNYVNIYVLQHTITLQRAAPKMQAELRAETFEKLRAEKIRLKGDLIAELNFHQRGGIANISIRRVNTMVEVL